jgi:hypothetical protein
MLRAPISLGDGSRTGAGAVVTKDVPPGKLAVGVPARLRDPRPPTPPPPPTPAPDAAAGDLADAGDLAADPSPRREGAS